MRFYYYYSLDYAFHFPHKGVDDFVKIKLTHTLTIFTVCLWMSSSNPDGTLFSYAVPGQDNELIIAYTNRKFQFTIDDTAR